MRKHTSLSSEIKCHEDYVIPIVTLIIFLPRLYSDYLYFGIANKSAEDFHDKVSESLQLFEGCLTESTMRSCVYNTTVNNAMAVSALPPSFLSHNGTELVGRGSKEKQME